MRSEVLVRSDLTARLSHQNQETQTRVQTRLNLHRSRRSSSSSSSPRSLMSVDCQQKKNCRTWAENIKHIESSSTAAAHTPLACISIDLCATKKKRNWRIWDPSSKRAGNFWCPFPWFFLLLLLSAALGAATPGCNCHSPPLCRYFWNLRAAATPIAQNSVPSRRR